MYDQQQRSRAGVMVDANQAFAQDADAREEMAHRLSREAMRQAQRAALGLLAVPASLALGLAATVTYGAAFLERGFELFERSLDRFARDGERESLRGEMGPMPARIEEPGAEKGKQARS
jgi:hypothetical protein